MASHSFAITLPNKTVCVNTNVTRTLFSDKGFFQQTSHFFSCFATRKIRRETDKRKILKTQVILRSKDKHYLVETKHIDVRYKNSEKPPQRFALPMRQVKTSRPLPCKQFCVFTKTA